MAVVQALSAPVRRLARLSLTSAHAEGLAAFYQQAFGYRRVAAARHAGPDFEQLMQVNGGAHSIVLGLGHELLQLLQFDQRGRPYPQGTTSSELIFQHFAIVVTDMGAALRQLMALEGWSAITGGGPQQLPERSGGVTAFKFRDPEGHPLELLAFPDTAVPSPWRARRGGGPCVGVDHSALCVADTARSVEFYEALGLKVSARSFNTGAEQARLDGLDDARVAVTALTPSQATPHVELLCYRVAADDDHTVLSLQSNDIAATRLVLSVEEAPALPASAGLQRRVLDPDGHHLLIG